MSWSEQRSEVATDSRFRLSFTLDDKYLCPFAAKCLYRVPVAIFFSGNTIGPSFSAKFVASLLPDSIFYCSF